MQSKTYDFKEYVKIVENVILNKTVTKFLTILTKRFLPELYKLPQNIKRNKIVSYILSKEINVSLLRKTKINCYENLDEKEIADEKSFWKTFKPLLCNKSIITKLISMKMEN